MGKSGPITAKIALGQSSIAPLRNVGRLGRLLNPDFHRGALAVQEDGLYWTPGRMARRLGLPTIEMLWSHVQAIRLTEFFVGEGFLFIQDREGNRLTLHVNPYRDVIDALVGGPFELRRDPTYPGDWVSRPVP